MKGDQCPDHEIVFKAILKEHYDSQEKRFSPRIFRGPNSSFSRRAVWSKKQIIEGFADSLENPSKDRFLIGLGSATVGQLKQVCINYNKEKPTAITIIEDPLDGTQPGGHINPAHAVIPQKLSDGLAKHIPSKIEIEWGTIEELLLSAGPRGCRRKFFHF